jgi:uncharacterized protein (DUF433 family)
MVDVFPLLLAPIACIMTMKGAAMTILTLPDTLPVVRDPAVLSGTPIFRGTRVPIQTLFDYIVDGWTLDQFLENFPTVKREDAITVLETLAESFTVG